MYVLSGLVGGVMACLLIAVLILFFGLVCTLCYRRCTKFGRHKPLTEEEAYERKKSTRKPRTISGPIPGITPKFDNSTDGKFTVHGESGRVLNLQPKIITAEDVATPPRPGENVKVVHSDEILVSQGG